MTSVRRYSGRAAERAGRNREESSSVGWVGGGGGSRCGTSLGKKRCREGGGDLELRREVGGDIAG